MSKDDKIEGRLYALYLEAANERDRLKTINMELVKILKLTRLALGIVDTLPVPADLPLLAKRIDSVLTEI